MRDLTSPRFQYCIRMTRRNRRVGETVGETVVRAVIDLPDDMGASNGQKRAYECPRNETRIGLWNHHGCSVMMITDRDHCGEKVALSGLV